MFKPIGILRCQGFNKRFYQSIVPGLILKMECTLTRTFHQRMVTDKAKVMVVKGKNDYNYLCPKMLKWVKFPILNSNTVLDNGYPTMWSKSAQISATEFFLTGGEINGAPQKSCFLLDTRTQKLEKKADLPTPLQAHVVCYTEVSGKVTGEGINCGLTMERLVFCLGGSPSSSQAHKYKVDDDTWSPVASMPIENFSFNCIPVRDFLYVFI